MFACHFLTLAYQLEPKQATTRSRHCCLSSSMRKARVPASNLPTHVHSIPHPTGSPDNKLDNLNPESSSQGIVNEVFKFQVPGDEWVISTSISGEFLWVQPPRVEGEWLRQRNMQCLAGLVCGGFGDHWAWCSQCPRGVNRRARGYHRLSAELTAGFFTLKRIWDICAWPQTVDFVPRRPRLFQAPEFLLRPFSLCQHKLNFAFCYCQTICSEFPSGSFLLLYLCMCHFVSLG
jgi:hypothetical protein